MSRCDTASAQRHTFYCAVLEQLNAAGVEYLVGGAFAMAEVTGIAARTKDLDLFLRRRDCPRALEILRRAGYETEEPFPHWLAKVHRGADVIDIIFNSGNGESPLDDSWFVHGLPAEIWGVPVKLCAVEEMIWTKAFVMERERYDGADIAHLLRVSAERLDWRRLLQRFGDHWPVLLSHLILFQYIYPGEAHRLPRAIVSELVAQIATGSGQAPTDPRLCRGGLMSRAQYAVDFLDWGYVDARLPPNGHIEAEDLRIWNDAAPDRRRLKVITAPIGSCAQRSGHGRSG